MLSPDDSKVCANCKHWDIPTEHEGSRLPKCNRIRHYERIEEELSKTMTWKQWCDLSDPIMKTKILEEGAYVEDGSGYYASFHTSPKFGCILFDPKS